MVLQHPHTRLDLQQKRPIEASTPSNEGEKCKRRREGEGAPRPWFGRDTPSHNDRMHPRNLYRHYTPDFTALAREYPDVLGKHVSWDGDRAVVNWCDPEATRAVTTTLLLHDFGITWDMPLEGLCPPVPNRLNYICWLADLVQLRDGNSSQQHDAAAAAAAAGTTTPVEPAAPAAAERASSSEMIKVGEASGALGSGGAGKETAPPTPTPPPCRGIDVGTGMSVIYPLLGYKTMGWRFLATDVSRDAVEWAQRNIAANGWEEFIEVRHVDISAIGSFIRGDVEEGASSGDRGGGGGSGSGGRVVTDVGPLRQALCDDDGTFDFAMTNPPFWASAEEAGLNPRTATGATATAAEVACEGGELAFVSAIVNDSIHLGTRIRWYTSMIGRKANVRKLLRVLREAGVRNIRTTEFFQGKTTRWGLAWSLTEEGLVAGRVPDDPHVKVLAKKVLHSNEAVFTVPLQGSLAAAAATAAEAAAAATPQKAGAQGKRAASASISVQAPPGAASAGEEHRRTVELTVPLPENLPADRAEVVARIRTFIGEFRMFPVELGDAVETFDAGDDGSGFSGGGGTEGGGDGGGESRGGDQAGGEGGGLVTLFEAVAMKGGDKNRKYRDGEEAAAVSASEAAGATAMAATAAASSVMAVAAMEENEQARDKGLGTAGTAAAAGAAAAIAATSMVPPSRQSYKSAESEEAVSFRFSLAVLETDADGAVPVRVQLHEGGDRKAFFQLCDTMMWEVARQNRRWRRATSRDSSGGGGSA